MIKIAKREDIDRRHALIVRAIAIVGALAFTGIFIGWVHPSEAAGNT